MAGACQDSAQIFFQKAVIVKMSLICSMLFGILAWSQGAFLIREVFQALGMAGVGIQQRRVYRVAAGLSGH